MSDEIKFNIGSKVRIKDTAFQLPASEDLHQYRGQIAEVVFDNRRVVGDYTISVGNRPSVWVYANEIESPDANPDAASAPALSVEGIFFEWFSEQGQHTEKTLDEAARHIDFLIRRIHQLEGINHK